jgi:hypothetical protein
VLIHQAVNPINNPTTVSITLAPNRSSNQPTPNIAAAAVSDPAVYTPDTDVRDHPNSSMIGSTNTEIAKVWPGPDTNSAKAAVGKITHP